MPKAFSENLIEAFGGASAALARADERVALSPNRKVLLARLGRLEQEALAQLEGEEILHDQLALDYGYSPRAWRRWPHAFVQVFATPLPCPGLPDAEAITRWLHNSAAKAVPATTRLSVEVFVDRLESWTRHSAAARHQPGLIAAADLAALFAQLHPLSRGNLAIATMLGDRCIGTAANYSSGGIAALGIMELRLPWARLLRGAPDEDADDLSASGMTMQIRLAWLEALRAGGMAVVTLAQRVALWNSRVDEVCSTKRQSSRLRQVAELAGKYPSLTASRLADLLGTSRQGATVLIGEALKEGVVREVTQGNAFRRYVAAI